MKPYYIGKVRGEEVHCVTGFEPDPRGTHFETCTQCEYYGHCYGKWLKEQILKTTPIGNIKPL